MHRWIIEMNFGHEGATRQDCIDVYGGGRKKASILCALPTVESLSCLPVMRKLRERERERRETAGKRERERERERS